jgi:SpoVK/Ycf46/Vps4 family AAA+-type ATPase
MGADLAGICREAGMEAIRRLIAQAKGKAPDVSRLRVTQPDLYAALARNAGRRADAEMEWLSGAGVPLRDPS